MGRIARYLALLTILLLTASWTSSADGSGSTPGPVELDPRCKVVRDCAAFCFRIGTLPVACVRGLCHCGLARVAHGLKHLNHSVLMLGNHCEIDEPQVCKAREKGEAIRSELCGRGIEQGPFVAAGGGVRGMTARGGKGVSPEFDMAFDEEYRKQRSWNVPDKKPRKEIKLSLVLASRWFYQTCQGFVRSDGEVERKLVRFWTSNADRSGSTPGPVELDPHCKDVRDCLAFCYRFVTPPFAFSFLCLLGLSIPGLVPSSDSANVQASSVGSGTALSRASHALMATPGRSTRSFASVYRSAP
ncbi:hypothetical protein NL676_029221 [Syzygium grande]|nr:hypothetical protein NL676_029221 [Syzygium grande]